MSKLQQDFLHPLFYFIHKDGLSTYDTTATPSDALPHNTTRQDWDRTGNESPSTVHHTQGIATANVSLFLPYHFSFFTNVLTEAIKALFTGREGFP